MLSPSLFNFLEDLKENNSRDWFTSQKKRYEVEVREPLLEFIRAFEPHLDSISPYFMAIAKKSGGSLFRIHRDVRFSKNKSPYKTNAGLHFRHENGKDAHCPGFYLHLEPGECFCGAGIWRPDSASLKSVRTAIVESPERWREVTSGPFELGGDQLKRPPRGFDADHPLVEDLKRKDHVAYISLTQTEITREDFLDSYVHKCRSFAPYVKFVSDALGQPF